MRMLWTLVLVAGCNDAAKTMKQLEQSKIEIANIRVRKLAVEAYPLWVRDHPATECPTKIDELGVFLNSPDDLVDPWKHPLVMLCGATAPAGAHGFAAYSLGPDGQYATSDDIKSWVDPKN